MLGEGFCVDSFYQLKTGHVFSSIVTFFQILKLLEFYLRQRVNRKALCLKSLAYDTSLPSSHVILEILCFFTKLFALPFESFHQ